MNSNDLDTVVEELIKTYGPVRLAEAGQAACVRKRRETADLKLRAKWAKAATRWGRAADELKAVEDGLVKTETLV